MEIGEEGKIGLLYMTFVLEYELADCLGAKNGHIQISCGIVQIFLI